MKLNEAIAARSQKRIEPVDLNIEGIEPVHVLRLNVGQVLKLAKLGDEEGGLRLVAESIVDEAGSPVFENIDQLRAIDWQLCQALIDASNQINGLADRKEQAGKN